MSFGTLPVSWWQKILKKTTTFIEAVFVYANYKGNNVCKKVACFQFTNTERRKFSPTPGLAHDCRSICTSAAAAKSLQSCPTLCDPIDGSPPGSPIPGILQARTLEWVAISFSNAWKWKVKVKSLSRVWLIATPWTAAHQAPPSMGFSRQDYQSGVPMHFKYIQIYIVKWAERQRLL